MHKMHNDSKTSSGPETTGATLHQASGYDFHSNLMGLGVNQSNSRMVVEMAKIKPGDTVLDVVISRLVVHHLPDDLKRRGFAEIFRVLKPYGRLFIADFKPPTNPLLAHVAAAVVGSQMMAASRLDVIPPLLMDTGFVEVTSGPTRSAFLAFVSGRKPSK